jgi:predicted transport protein
VDSELSGWEFKVAEVKEEIKELELKAKFDELVKANTNAATQSTFGKPSAEDLEMFFRMFKTMNK